MFVSFLLLACQPEEAAVSVPPEVPVQEQNLADSPSNNALVRTLSVRDSGLDCQTLKADDLQMDLTYVVENVTRPPWAGMRAAACLAELYPTEAQPDFVRWVQDPKTKGLAFLLAGQIKRLPDPVAIEVAQAGLSGPHAPDFRVRLEKVNDIRMKDLLDK